MPRSLKFVCADCIEDAALQELVEENATSTLCSYCGTDSEEPSACNLDVVVERIQWVIDEMFTDPAGELGFCSREGGYIGTYYESPFELFQEGIEYYPSNDALGDDILRRVEGEVFCWKDAYGPTADETFGPSWDEFARVVKHERRYTFWQDNKEDRWPGLDRIPPGDMMQSIGGKIHHVCSVSVLRPETRFWRVRVHTTASPITEPSEFTSPPIEFANQPNRMSPAGIPMFYGTEDFDTALQETVDPTGLRDKSATGFQFESLVSLNILDLTAIPVPYSFFLKWGRYFRDSVEFMRSFAHQLSLPIERDGRQHIEYVPTQVFTEFVRYELRTPDDERYHGIKYRSSRNQLPCYVLFLDQAACLPPASTSHVSQILNFVSDSKNSVELG